MSEHQECDEMNRSESQTYKYASFRLIKYITGQVMFLP
jgi:hypothetical protein